jgi:type III secretion protein D
MVFFRKGNFLYELFAQARHSLEGDQFMGGFMKQELRVLCGLHRGACLPVSLGDTLTVGADADSDVVLVDPGVRALELTLEVTDEGVRYTRPDAPEESRLLPWGEPLVCASVVLMVCGVQESWSFMTVGEVPEPVALESLEPLELPSAELSQSASPLPTKTLPPKWSMRRFLIGKNPRVRLGLAAMLMLGFTTYSISRNIQQSYASAPSPSMPRKFSGDVEQSPLLIAGKLSADSALGRPGSLGQSELQHKIKQRLKEAYLYEKLDFQLTESEWVIRGVLDEDESRLLSRILTNFYKEYDVKSVLRASVNSPEEMLPFKIQQFTGGAQGSVVTADGQRLYIGDTHLGYTLQKIDGKKLLFAGKNKVEVIW